MASLMKEGVEEPDEISINKISATINKITKTMKIKILLIFSSKFRFPKKTAQVKVRIVTMKIR